MNFNVYLDKDTGRKLSSLARRKRVTRNALVRQAVSELVEREERAAGWSREVLEWRGDPTFESFESRRTDLQPERDDPLA